MIQSFFVRSNIIGFCREFFNSIRLQSVLAGIEKRSPVLVFQMGKVGSSTVVRTLEQAGIEPVFHLHALSRAGIHHAITRQRQSIKPYLDKHLLLSRALRRKLDRSAIPCKIITLTREPISRALSFVFEDRAKQIPDAILENGRVDIDKVKFRLSNILAGDNGTADPTVWFDRELLDCFGVDVFSHPYDFERGYTILSGPAADVLLIRLEDLNRSLVPALSSFLGVGSKDLVVANSNVGETKRYATELEAVKRSFKVSPSIAERLLSTRYFEHFYGPDKEAVLKRWVDPVETV